MWPPERSKQGKEEPFFMRHYVCPTETDCQQKAAPTVFELRYVCVRSCQNMLVILLTACIITVQGSRVPIKK